LAVKIFKACLPNLGHCFPVNLIFSFFLSSLQSLRMSGRRRQIFF
jgi:hypothetical protein